MAGMSCASALAPHFRRVVLLERDGLEGGRAPRRGVPQGRHVHFLLVSGLRALEALLPGLGRELEAAGAVQTQVGRSMRFITHGAPVAAFEGPLSTYLISRPMLEWLVRRRVKAIANVELYSSAKVAAPIAERGVVRGVVLANGERLDADLVVDASGRSSRALHWLRELGKPTPAEERYEICLTYTSQNLRLAQQPSWDILYAAPTPGGNRSGVIMRVEQGQYVATLAGYQGDHARPDDEAFLAYAARIHPELAQVLRHAVEVGPFHVHRLKRMNWRMFHRLREHPEGLLVVGDALGQLDPVYGQGMSVAAMEAGVLGALLGQHGHVRGLPGRFYRAVAPIIGRAWNVSVAEELRRPVSGRRPLGLPLIHRYLDQVLHLAHRHPSVSRAFAESTHMTTGRLGLFRPGVLGRVLLREAGVLR